MDKNTSQLRAIYTTLISNVMTQADGKLKAGKRCHANIKQRKAVLMTVLISDEVHVRKKEISREKEAPYIMIL